MGSVIDNTNFATIDVSAAFGTAFYGLDLESYAAASDILESGLDTSSLALPINIEFNFGAAGLATTMNVLTAAAVDAIYTLDAQGMLTVSM